MENSTKRLSETKLISINLEGKSGESRISAIEKSNANLTPELAFAYSKVFDVSLEYIFCLSNYRKPENKSVEKVLCLTDKSTAKIKELSSEDNSKALLHILNILFENNFMKELVCYLDSFIVTNHVYGNMISLSFDYRIENDTEIVKLIPRWRLEKSILALIEDIADFIEHFEDIKYDD